MTKPKLIIKDVFITLLFSLIPLLAIYLDFDQILRIPLSFVYILILPGYGLMAALFPHRDDHTGSERLILSIGVSLVIVPLLGFLLNFSYIGISLETIVFSTSLFILLSCVITVYRRRRLPIQDRFMAQFEISVPGWFGKRLLDRFLSIMLVASIIVTLGALAYGMSSFGIGESFTEFYVLGPSGVSGDYPTEVVAHRPVTLILGVSNHEYSDVQYRIEWVDGTKLKRVTSISLRDGERWEQPYTIRISNPATQQLLQFFLYIGDDTKPYRSIHLWVRVVGEESSPGWVPLRR